MKKRMLSVLLIIIMLVANFTVCIFPVQAKLLIDYPHEVAKNNEYFYEVWIGNQDFNGIIKCNTLDEYLNATYKNYANIDKSEITHLYIWGHYIYDIEDLSGLSEFENLEVLHIDSLVDKDVMNTIELSQLTNLKYLYLDYCADIDSLGINNLSNLIFLDIMTEDIEFDLNLNNFKKLEFFCLLIEGKTGNFNNAEELTNVIKQQIVPLEGYDIAGTGYFFDEEDGTVFQGDFYLMEPLDVQISTNKVNYNLGEKVNTKISWDKGMQATDFEILFDSSKLKLNNSSIGEAFYNLVEPGRIIVSWASFEEIDTTEINFEFTTLGTGKTDIVILPENFANGELDSQFLFTHDDKCSINIEKNEIINEGASIEIDVINNKEIISGLTLIDDKAVIQKFLDEKHFAPNLEVKIFNQKDEEVTDTSKDLGTGYKVRLYSNEEMIKEYLTVVYGDTTGEGEITAFDALTLIKVINKKIEFTDDIFYEAGRIITKNGNEPTAIDALAIVKHLNKKYTIIQ